MPSLYGLIVFAGSIIVFAIVFSMIRASSSFAPWIPSSIPMAKRAFDFLELKPGLKLADLGCGDGRILFFANRAYDCACDGFEISLLPYLIAKLRQLIRQGRPINIQRKNLFDVDLSGYDIIYLYGLPKQLNEKLVPKLEQELKPGCIVLSYNFSLAKKAPVKEFHDRWRNLFVYRF